MAIRRNEFRDWFVEAASKDLFLASSFTSARSNDSYLRMSTLPRVLDPLCGAGMTNVEAKIYLLDFRAWRSALCPISTYLVSDTLWKWKPRVCMRQRH